MMKCNGCLSDLQKLEYQSRSADEAHTVVYKCPYCPLDIDKFFASIPKPHIYLNRTKRIPSRTPTVNFNCIRQSILLYVQSRNTKLWKNKTVLQARACNRLDGKSNLFKVYSSGPWKHNALHKGASKKIALNSYAVAVSFASYSAVDAVEYTDFEYVEIENYTGILDDNSVCIVQEIDDNSDENILFHLQKLYLIGFCPDYLPNYVSKVSLGSMSNLSARGYDARSVKDGQYYFGVKVDGERMWIVRAGSTWLYVRRLTDFEVIGFEIDTKVLYMHDTAIGPVIDIEYMIGFDHVLIDILADENSITSPYDRNMEWIRSKMLCLTELFPYLSKIHCRQFFDSFSEAQKHSMSVKYPIDGIVAISHMVLT